MLADKRALATVAVKDLRAAEKFYTEVLGLAVSGREGEEAISFKAGESELLVYRSQYAGTNKATAVSWIVGEGLEEIVKQLDSRGAKFEHYDLPEMTRKGHVHSGGDTRVAWFTDPDGNIHSLATG